MNKKHAEQFEAWRKNQILQFTDLRGWDIRDHIDDIEELCREAFEAGLNICACEGCIRHNGRYFDVEEYYIDE